MDFLLLESNDDSNQLPEARSEDDDDKTIVDWDFQQDYGRN